MSKPLELEKHLKPEELYERYRHERDGRTKAHFHVIWLKSQGKQTAEIAAVSGFKTDWVRQLIRRYNREGPESLGDRRSENGQEPALTAAEQQRLLEALQGRSPDGGLWNGPKVNQWIQKTLGKKVSNAVGWSYLKRLGFVLKMPRPRHIHSDEAAQAAFKKNSPRMWMS